MNDKKFIDTNILIYCYTKDEEFKREKAITAVNTPNAFISTQVLTELSNTLSKKFKLSWDEVEAVVFEIRDNFHVYVIIPDTIQKAYFIAKKYKYSFFDSLIIAAALSCNCQTLYSEDMQDGQIIENKLVIKNPLT